MAMNANCVVVCACVSTKGRVAFRWQPVHALDSQWHHWPDEPASSHSGSFTWWVDSSKTILDHTAAVDYGMFRSHCCGGLWRGYGVFAASMMGDGGLHADCMPLRQRPGMAAPS